MDVYWIKLDNRRVNVEIKKGTRINYNILRKFKKKSKREVNFTPPHKLL